VLDQCACCTAAWVFLIFNGLNWSGVDWDSANQTATYRAM